jgi:hypothetical protein
VFDKHRLFLAGTLFMGLGLSASASAQSTDGYHSMQILPMVVDTASFASRFNFHNPNSVGITIRPKYYPSKGTSATITQCNDLAIGPGKTVTVTSLRNLCALPPTGSQFGFLSMIEISPDSLPFTAFARVANPQGNGFTVEAFPAHTFTSADAVINGLRRLASTPNSPAFQTNCLFANLNEVTASQTPSSTRVTYALYSNNSTKLAEGFVDLLPGQFERLLDVFKAAGLGDVGDYDDAYIRVREENADLNLGEPGIISFCTVQDNTSFGADFRIGKQEMGNGGQSVAGDSIGSQDNHVARETRVSADTVGRPFQIAAGASANTHVFYFRHPDMVRCEITDTNGARLTLGSGLEMRMLDEDGVQIAGGQNVTGWGDFFMGDKTERNNGANTRYTIEVESNETNTGVARSYQLHCRSGSGHTLGDLIRYQEALDRF